MRPFQQQFLGCLKMRPEFIHRCRSFVIRADMTSARGISLAQIVFTGLLTGLAARQSELMLPKKQTRSRCP